MIDIFGNDKAIRGCFAVYRLDSSASRGAQLLLPSGSYLPGTAPTEPLLVIGFDMQQQESVLYNRCFGNRVYSYAFGHDPNASNCRVHFVGFLVDKKNYSGVVGEITRAYYKNRISISKQYATLVLGNTKPVLGFIVGMSSSTLDPQHSLQSFTIDLSLPGTQNQG